jgi:hypothetical protein
MTVNGDGRLRVFVIGTNNQVYHKSQTTAGAGLDIIAS